MTVVSSCPHCGAPIYGPTSVIANDPTPPQVVYSCSCRFSAISWPEPLPPQPYNPWDQTVVSIPSVWLDTGAESAAAAETISVFTDNGIETFEIKENDDGMV